MRSRRTAEPSSVCRRSCEITGEGRRLARPETRRRARQGGRDPLADELGGEQPLGLRARADGAATAGEWRSDAIIASIASLMPATSPGDSTAATAGRDALGRAHLAGGDDHHAGGERLGDGQPEGLVLARLQQHVAARRARPGTSVGRHRADEFGVRRQVLEQLAVVRPQARAPDDAKRTSAPRSCSRCAIATTSSTPLRAAMRPSTSTTGGVAESALQVDRGEAARDAPGWAPRPCARAESRSRARGGRGTRADAHQQARAADPDRAARSERSAITATAIASV